MEHGPHPGSVPHTPLIVLAHRPSLCPCDPWNKGQLDKQTQEGEGSGS